MDGKMTKVLGEGESPGRKFVEKFRERLKN
jgi:hypothetical protein